MKNYKILFPIIVLSFMFTNYSFGQKGSIKVEFQNDVPNGTEVIVLNTDIESVKSAFSKEGFVFTAVENGFETNEILLNSTTRAKYKIESINDELHLRAYWGITEKVKKTVKKVVGDAAASKSNVDDCRDVIYEAEYLRPKKVFDYALQIIKQNNFPFSYQ